MTEQAEGSVVRLAGSRVGGGSIWAPWCSRAGRNGTFTKETTDGSEENGQATPH